MIKIVVAGRSASLETLLAASALLEKEEQTEARLNLGNPDWGRDGRPVALGKDRSQRDIYVMGTPNYRLLPRIKKQLEEAVHKQAELVVITFTSPGENLHAWLINRSSLPLIGSWLAAWAKRRVESRREEILQQARQWEIDDSFRREALAAAKPLLPHS